MGLEFNPYLQNDYNTKRNDNNTNIQRSSQTQTTGNVPLNSQGNKTDPTNGLLEYFVGEMSSDQVYDSNGNVVKETTRSLKDGKVLGFTEYEYDENGKQTKIVNKDADGKILSNKTIEYDENGKKTKETKIFDDRSVSEFYNQNGQVTKSEEYDLDGNVVSGASFEYNEAGSITKQTEYGANGILQNYEINEYDESGKVVLKSTSYNQKVSYDENGNMQLGDFIKSVEMEYAENGQLLKETKWKRNGEIRYIHDFSDLKESKQKDLNLIEKYNNEYN